MSAQTILRKIRDANNFFRMTDAGSGNTFTVDRSPAYCPIRTAGAENRTLARPTEAGTIAVLAMETDGGDATLTVTGGYNEDGDTTFTFSDPGQFLILVGCYETSGGTFFWRKIADHQTGDVTATELGYLDGVTAGTVTASKALVVGASSELVGAIAFQGRITTTDGVSSGTARVVGGLAYSNTAASTAVTGSTTAEQLFDVGYTIPANTLKAGTMVRVRAQGIATGTQANDTVAYKLYIGGSGGTAIISAAATDAANNDTFQMEATIVCRTAGATGTLVATGTYKVSSAEGTMTVKDDITASTTVNTTANQAISVTATWSAANGTNTCRLDILTVEVY